MRLPRCLFLAAGTVILCLCAAWALAVMHMANSSDARIRMVLSGSQQPSMCVH